MAANLATDLAACGDHASAADLGNDTLRRLRALLGEHHPVTLACTANLATALRESGAIDEGAALREEVIDAFGRTLGVGHPDAQRAYGGHPIDLGFDPPPL